MVRAIETVAWVMLLLSPAKRNLSAQYFFPAIDHSSWQWAVRGGCRRLQS